MNIDDGKKVVKVVLLASFLTYMTLAGMAMLVATFKMKGVWLALNRWFEVFVIGLYIPSLWVAYHEVTGS